MVVAAIEDATWHRSKRSLHPGNYHPSCVGATVFARARSCALACGNVGKSCCAAAFAATNAPARYSTSAIGPVGLPVSVSVSLPANRQPSSAVEVM